MGAFLAVLAGIAIPLIIAYKGKGSRRVWAGMILIGLLVFAISWALGETLEKTEPRWMARASMGALEIAFGFALGSLIAFLRIPAASKNDKQPSTRETGKKE
jgi:Kef-type K+ transport system membrane component KefB